MKSKLSCEANHKVQSACDQAASKSINEPRKKISAKRTSIKLVSSAEKHTLIRNKDKSAKLTCLDSFGSESTNTAKVVSDRAAISKKMKVSSQNKSTEHETNNRKKEAQKKEAVVKAKKQKGVKRKEKMLKQSSASFIDVWALGCSGKREASLNASVKVNIMFERYSPSKSSKSSNKKAGIPVFNQDENTTETNNPVDSNIKDKVVLVDEVCNVKCGAEKSPSTIKVYSSTDKESSKSSLAKSESPSKSGNKNSNCKSKTSEASSRKRKSPGYKIFKEESVAKVCKVDTSLATGSKKKIRKQFKKGSPSSHQQCNIIDKCPRQASLVARAMIAMEQEEDIGHELSARTRVYDWMELRSLSQAESRRIEWYNGFGNITARRPINKDGVMLSKDDPTLGSMSSVGQSDHLISCLGGDTIHSSLLKTLHLTGDSRLLKEYFRAQKDDFDGIVDVETCTLSNRSNTSELCTTPKKCFTPERCNTPEKQLSSPDTKKNVPPQTAEEKTSKDLEKPLLHSSAKLQSCHVATPASQFSTVQKSGSMSNGFIHHPVPQQQHNINPSQPITSFSPSPAYVYQYAMDRPQGGLYAPPTLSPVSYTVGNNETAHREYPSSFALGHVDSLTLSRRGVSPFQPPTYNAPVHLPMQPIGFNYGAYYPSAIPQQNIPAMQTISIHQQYPLMQTPVISQMPQDMAQIDYTTFPALANPGQDAACMPPPTHPAHRPTPITGGAVQLRQASLSHHLVPPVAAMEPSLISVNPMGLQPIIQPPALEYSPNFIHCQTKPHEQYPTFSPCRPHYQLPPNEQLVKISPLKYSVTCHGLTKPFNTCKKEQDETVPYNCDFVSKNPHCNNDCLSSSFGSSRANPESSDVSDLLHSAHTAMYQIDAVSSMDNIREFNQALLVDSTQDNCSPSKISIPVQSSYNVSYSVSTIHDKPDLKVKLEPQQKECTSSSLSDVLNFDHKLSHAQSAIVCFASAGSSGPQSKETSDSPHYVHKKSTASDQITLDGSTSNNQMIKHESTPDKTISKAVIIIDDTDESSDDEPLSRLVKTKSLDSHITHDHSDTNSRLKVGEFKKKKISTSNIPKQHKKEKIKKQNKLKEKVKEHSTPSALNKVKKTSVTSASKCVSIKPSYSTTSKDRLNTTQKEIAGNTKIQSSESQSKAQREKEAKIKVPKKTAIGSKTVPKKTLGSSPLPKKTIGSSPLSKKTTIGSSPLPKKTIGSSPLPKKTIGSSPLPKKTIGSSPLPKKTAIGKKTSVGSSSKSKKATKKINAQPVLPGTPTKVSANHGWSWVGEGRMQPIPKLTQGREEAVRIRKCYQAMKHTLGETVSVRDSVILHSDGDGSIPFVAKVSALWENQNGEMMFSMLWYYQPEHTATGREHDDGDQELFASKHREENSVACIDDKCYVLMYNEYCRLEAEAVRLEQDVPLPRWRQLMPGISQDDKKFCNTTPPSSTCADNIWFCRYDYDFRKKIVKKPKHKKSNLRYRVPVKLSETGQPLKT